MSRKSAYNTQVDDTIMKALVRAEGPLRYNELHRRANGIFGQRIWIKTFNDHLKKLCEKSMVTRKEKSRYYVTYEVEEKNIDDYASDRSEQMKKEFARLRREHAELESLRAEVGRMRRLLDNPLMVKFLEEKLAELLAQE